jgi:hypothetical protein
MRIRCLLIAAFAAGVWGVSWSWAQDDAADSEAAELVRVDQLEETAGGVANEVETAVASTVVDPTTPSEGEACPAQDWDFCCDPCAARWRVAGEIGAGLGSSSNADNDRYLFRLTQELEDPQTENKYEFYQRYEIDRSYVDAHVLTLGAKQLLKDWHSGGDLRLREEFRRYDDRNFDSNDRQEGLFDLRWEPKWDCDCWNAELAYRYNIKEYETFSPLSYKLHRGRARVERKLSEDLEIGAHAEVVTYNYSFGSDRDNLRTEVGVDAGWRTCDTDWRASIEHEEKEFDLKKELGYSEDRADLSVNWRIDCSSRLSARMRGASHERPFEPDRSYDEWLADATYFRQLSCEWSARLRGMQRSKQFGDPTDDLDQTLGEFELAYQPSKEWTWTGSVQRDEYAYANPLRAFTRDRWRLGAQYYYCDLSLGVDYERQVNSYDADPDRDWQRDNMALNVGYRHGCHDFRLYGQFAVLDQSDTASVNDYDETQLAASWSYKIDCTTDFILSYEDRERRYDVQPAVRDRLVEARLRFEL